MKRDNLFKDRPDIRSILDLYKHDLIEIFSPTWNKSYFRLYQKFLIDLKPIVKQAKPSGKLLDVGCAQGNFTKLFVELGYKVTALDINSNYIEYTRSKLERNAEDVEFVSESIFNFKSIILYDVIFIGEVIEHVSDPLKLLGHLSTLLAPDGIIILTTPNQEYCRNRLPDYHSVDFSNSIEFFPDGDGHFFLFKPSEIINLVESTGELVIDSSQFYRSVFLTGDLKIRYLHEYLPKWLHFSIETLICRSLSRISFLFSQSLFVIRKVK